MGDNKVYTKSRAERYRDANTGTDNVGDDFGTTTATSYMKEQWKPLAIPSRLVDTSDMNPGFVSEVQIVFQELQDLLLTKHKDYGPKNISQSPGGPLNGLRVRIHDKQARINNLLDNNRTPEHEALEDSFIDMANYAIIALLVLRDKWDK